MKTKKYFIIIDPYVFFLCDSKSVFFYNTLNSKYIESTEKSIISFFTDIQGKKNLSVKIIYEKDLIKDLKLKKFISKLRAGFFGDIIELKNGENPPIQLYPILGLKRTESGKFDFTGEQNTLDYLKNINVYLNNQCNLNCDFCGSAYKQFLCCNKSEKSMDIDYKYLSELIKYLQEYPNVHLSFSGGNIFEYSNLNDIIELIKSTKNRKSFYMHYLNLYNNLDKLILFKGKNIQLNVLADFPVKGDAIKRILLETKKNDISLKFNLIIKNESELDDLYNDEFEISNYSIRPFFTGKNKTFFRQNVYFNKTDILKQNLSIKDIFYNQVFNKNFLGVINIASNGDYLINFNRKSVGNINKDSINDIVNNELIKNGDWFLTRNKVKPCKDCNFRFLCSAISNYELSIGKYDLCKLRARI